jgi:hypothetical protein
MPLGNAINLGVTIAVSRDDLPGAWRPFLFPISPAHWNGLTDMTDARLLARHLEWPPQPRLHAINFNVDNGDVFRWSWTRLASGSNYNPQPISVRRSESTDHGSSAERTATRDRTNKRAFAQHTS